jgi:hypothetical protein
VPDGGSADAGLLPELDELEALSRRAGKQARLRTLACAQVRGQSLPIQVVTMGSDDPAAPALGLFGGVHAVERIGSEVVLAYMHTLIEGLAWSPALQQLLQGLHLVFMPMVNPGGLLQRTRCNPNGVDLMRNAPVDSSERVAFLAGGQRISRMLPWYRGQHGAPMEPEARALCRVVEEHLLGRPFCIALDCHSGFGLQDRVWFPYAYTRKPFAHLAEAQCLKNMFLRTYPNHRYYRIEPQSLNYTAHGDLWDYLYDKALALQNGSFVPLTLEMGSWEWVRKNPRQLLKGGGIFNPLMPHRQRRILRRHLVLMEFLLRVVHGYRTWLPQDQECRTLVSEARRCWYGDDSR